MFLASCARCVRYLAAHLVQGEQHHICWVDHLVCKRWQAWDRIMWLWLVQPFEVSLQSSKRCWLQHGVLMLMVLQPVDSTGVQAVCRANSAVTAANQACWGVRSVARTRADASHHTAALTPRPATAQGAGNSGCHRDVAAHDTGWGSIGGCSGSG
jgi:hypothetical protein